MAEMNEIRELRVLVVSSEPWDDSNNVGNTLSNFFREMTNVRLANVYFNFGMPNNEIESSYFQITEKSLVKNLINRNEPSGLSVSAENNAATRNNVETKSFDIMRKIRLQVFFWARELIWKVGRVESSQLSEFIYDFSPDVIFTPMNDTVYQQRECRKIAKRFDKSICAFIGDDIYSLRRIKLSPLFWIDRLIKRSSHRRFIKQCSKVFVMTDAAKKEYDRSFGIDTGILTKGLDFSNEPVINRHNGAEVIRFVYTGNLYAGRWKSLASLGMALQRLNDEGACGVGKRAELIVYSMTPMTKRMMTAFEVPAIRFNGGVPSSEIPAIQQSADVLVHAESMQKKNMLIVRLSFSTKLVDYMHVPRCILAIGPKEQASMDHLIRHDAAIAVTDCADMYDTVKRLVQKPELIEEYAEKAWRCGTVYHNRTVVQKRLYEELLAAARENKA